MGASGYEESPAGGPADVEFIHVGARWCDPSTGRFLQRDPIGIEGTLNVYAYADNQPSETVDPAGFNGTTVDKAMVKAIAAGDTAEVENILACTDTILSAEARAAGEHFVRKMGSRAVDWIVETRKGSIWREFPGGEKGKWADMTLEEIQKLAKAGDNAAKKAWKLVNDKRFLKKRPK